MPAIEKELKDVHGYRYPFEGEKHLATLIQIPYRLDTWREGALPAQESFLSLVKAISAHERCVVAIDPRIPYSVVRRFQLKNVTILRLPYDDSWARDNSPIFLSSPDGRLCGVDFSFNAWGGEFDGLYPDFKDDDAFSRRVLLELRIPRLDRKGFVLEGGSVLTDGRGTLLTTEECLLSPGRNPGKTKEEIEAILKESLCQKQVLFLPHGLYEDETDGHVDNICAFLDPRTIALTVPEDKEDPQYRRSMEDMAFLKAAKDAEGASYTILTLPMPGPLYLSREEAEGLENTGTAVERKEGRRLAASYANLYQGEDFLLLPQFGVKEDAIALKTLSEFYGGRKKIYPIPSREILLGGGNIHCVTKEIPYSSRYPIEPEEGK